MTLLDLRAYYGTYSEMARQLKLGVSTYRIWKRKGYIPLNAQVAIEVLTNGRFKASFNDVDKEDVCKVWDRWGRRK